MFFGECESGLYRDKLQRIIELANVASSEIYIRKDEEVRKKKRFTQL